MSCCWVDQPLQSLHKCHLEGPCDETQVDVDLGAQTYNPFGQIPA